MTRERTRQKRTRGEPRFTSADAPVRSIASQSLLQKLQRSVGNRTMQVLSGAGFLQRKLRIGAPNDIYEREADRVADEVMRMPAADLQRAPE